MLPLMLLPYMALMMPPALIPDVSYEEVEYRPLLLLLMLPAYVAAAIFMMLFRYATIFFRFSRRENTLAPYAYFAAAVTLLSRCHMMPFFAVSLRQHAA